MHWPDRMTALATEVDALFWLVLAITGAWLVAAEAYLFFCLWCFREETTLPMAKPWHVSGIVVALTGAVLACDLVIEAYSLPLWRTMKQHAVTPDTEILAYAKQFRWRFVYPGPDGRLGTSDDREIDSELHVPEKANVRLVLRSEDVIHSFFIPAARLKQDVLPGREAVVWFRAERPGRFEIACAELCGFAHYTMRAFLFVHSPESFREWLEQEGQISHSTGGALVAPGRG